jgi:hypothetical protein
MLLLLLPPPPPLLLLLLRSQQQPIGLPGQQRHQQQQRQSSNGLVGPHRLAQGLHQQGQQEGQRMTDSQQRSRCISSSSMSLLQEQQHLQQVLRL